MSLSDEWTDCLQALLFSDDGVADGSHSGSCSGSEAPALWNENVSSLVSEVDPIVFDLSMPIVAVGPAAAEPVNVAGPLQIVPIGQCFLQQSDMQVGELDSIVPLINGINVPAEDEVHAVANHVYDRGLNIGQSDVCTDLNINRKTLIHVSRRLACLTTFAERWYASLLMRAFHDVRDEALLFLLEMCYGDETPLKVRRDGDVLVLTHDHELVWLAADRNVRAECGEGAKVLSHSGKEDGRASLFQQQQRYSMLIELNGNLLEIAGSFGNSVMIMSVGNGRCLQKVLEMGDSLEQRFDRFQQRLRVAIIDKGSYNKIGEVQHVASRRIGWLLWLLHCLLHIVATTHKRTFLLQDTIMSRLVHLQLSFSGLVERRNFKGDLAATILSRLVWVAAVPGPEAAAFKAATIKLFLSDPADKVRAAMVVRVFTGDWRNIDKVEILIPLQLLGTEQLAKWKKKKVHEITSIGAWALTGPKLTMVYNKSKWDGVADSIAGPGLLAQVHGLAKPAYLAWLQRFAKQKSSKVQVPRARSAADVDGLLALVDNPMPSASSTHPPIEGIVVSSSADGPDGQPSAKEGVTPEDHEKHRTLGRCLVEEGNLDLLPSLTIVAQPMQALLKRFSQMGGEDYERKQQTGLLRRDTGIPNKREYPLQRCASLRDLNDFEKSVRLLIMSEVPWDVLLPHCRTEAICTDSFCLLSRSLALATYLLRPMLESQPMSLFQCLGDSSRAVEAEQTLRRVPPCLRHHLVNEDRKSVV